MQSSQSVIDMSNVVLILLIFVVFKAVVVAETEIICEDDEEEINCGADTISISVAVYGRTHLSTCGWNFHTNCAVDVTNQLAYCNGQTECEVEASNDLNGDPCGGVGKYLNISYSCIEAVCDADWVHHAASGNCYLVYEDNESWSTAREYCLGLGGDLASIHSEEENEFIQGLLSSNTWFGLTDEESEGAPYFSDGTATDYFNFEDDVSESDEHNCGLFKEGNGQWDWKQCDHHKDAICKKTSALATTAHPDAPATTHPVNPTTPISITTEQYVAEGAPVITSQASEGSPTTPEATHPSDSAIGLDLPSTATPSGGYEDIIVELFLYPNYVPSIDNIFKVNDTIHAIASIISSFQPLSSEIQWSITNQHSGQSMEYTVYSEDAVLVIFDAPSVYSIVASSVGKDSIATETAIVKILPVMVRVLCPTYVYAESEMWCTLLADSVVEDSSYTVCFEGSEDSCVTANPGAQSAANLPDALADDAPSMEGFFASFLNHTYVELGSFRVTVELFQRMVAEAQVNISVNPECMSSLTITEGRGNATHPATYLRASDIHISAQIGLNGKCIDPMSSDFLWSVRYTSDDGTGNAFETITHTPQVIIPSGTLAYGTYVLSLDAALRLRTSGAVVGEKQSATWLEIQASPLVAAIKGGHSRIHGLSSSLIVDGSTSYDPDVTSGLPSNLTFTWYCVLITADAMYATHEEMMENSDNACFEDEGIMMSSTSSKIEFVASQLEVNVTMNFWLIVSKEGRTSEPTQQRIQLTVGLLPQIEISCISNCNMYILTSERLVLYASCANCDDGGSDEVSHEWSLQSDNAPLKGNLPSQTTTGVHQAYLVIKANAFESVSETGSVVFRATGTLSNSSTSGFAEILLLLNAPPTPGNCTLIPSEGFALQTDFTVTCNDFSDVDSPLSYQMILFSSVEEIDGDLVSLGEGFQLYEGSESLKDGLSLPVGDSAHNDAILIQVNVRDSYMASTPVLLSAFVHAPTFDGSGESANEELLLNMTESVESDVNTLLATGNTGQATQLISALGSILNSVGSDDDTQQGESGRETRAEIRASLIDSVAAIPVESMSSLKQSSAALAVITHNKKEVSADVQLKAANALSEMTSFLKAETGSSSSSQDVVESAGTILVEGLSNIFSAAEETESALPGNASQDAGDANVNSKNLTKAALSAIGDIQDAVVAGKIPSEAPTIITSPTLSLAVSSMSKENLAQAAFAGSAEDGLGSFSLPSADGTLDQAFNSVNGSVVSMQMSALKWNPFGSGFGGDSINSSVIGIQLKADDETLQVQDLSSDISIYLPATESPLVDPVIAGITKEFSASLFVNHSSLPEDGALHLRILAENEPVVVLSICLANITINETTCVGNSSVTTVDDDGLDDHDNFTWSVSSAELSDADGLMISLYKRNKKAVYQNDNITLIIYMHTSQCIFWNEDYQAWSSSGCKVGPLSNPTRTHCLCNHLTFFGSSLFVPPNKINIFKDARLFLTFVDNPIVVSFVACILAGYVPLAVWARRKDKRDAARAAVTVLEDNDPYHQYRYDITVVTGMRRGSGTTATVTLTLIGKEGRSDPHVLHDRFSTVLTRGSTDSFLLTTAEGLGDIQAVRLWHNNAGSSPQWYVSHCTVHDLESDERYYFICNKWMMVGGGGVGLDNTFHIASPKDLHKFGHLFTARTIRDLRDGHLWLSVLMRPKSSGFTCVQRVSCCLSLLMCSMMTSIMFYGIPNDPADQVMDFGSFRITIKEIIIGIESSIIAFPINLLIVTIFRNIRPSIKLRSNTHPSKYAIKGKSPDAAHSLSSIYLTPRESHTVKSTDNLTSKSETKSVQIREDSLHNQPSLTKTSSHWVGGGDSSSTSTVDVKMENKTSSTSSYASLPSSVSLNSVLFHQEMDNCIIRSVSAVVKEWGNDKPSKQVEIFGHGGLEKVDQQSKTTVDATTLSLEDKSDQTTERGNLPGSKLDLMPQTKGVTHNFYLYSRLMNMVKELANTSADRFYDPEEHKQAMREAQTIAMTAFDIGTPPISPDQSQLTESLAEGKIKLRTRGLPHACVYIAWFLVVATVLASSYITMLYGLKYGKQTSIDWLISLFIATFQSIFITQPIKVLFLAIFISLVFKQIEPEEDFSDDIEELEVGDAKEAHRQLMKRRNTIAHYHPPATSTINTHLRNKQLTARMYSLLWQIAGFLCFFYLLITITYSQKDRQAYWMTRGTKGLFFYHKNRDYHLMCDFRSFLTWADSTLLPSLLGDDRWGAEKQSTLIGGGLRLRQVRVKPSSCETHPQFVDLINDCRALFTSESVDKGLYNSSWSQPIVNTSTLFNSSQTAEEWSIANYSPWYFYPDRSAGMWGHTMTIPSSGYIWVLGTTYDEAKESLAQMVDARWLDARTRALFVEWTSYNANTNLFCVVTFLMETPATGGLLKLPEVQVVRLHRYAANYKLFVIICEILFVLALFFVMYREYLRYKPLGMRKYFGDKWNWLEVAIIINCYISAGLYIYRYLITKQLFKQMRDDSVRFVGFRSAAMSDNALGYSLAVVIILSCIKFLYLLRLNPRMYLLTAVMSDCYHEVSAFTFLLFILIFCFAFPMSITFGSLPDYRTIVTSAVTLFTTLPGNFVYADLMTVHRVLGPLCLLVFQYWGCYLFLDLLIAALNESMVTIRRHPPPPSENRKIGLLLLSKIFSLLGIPERFHIGLD